MKSLLFLTGIFALSCASLNYPAVPELPEASELEQSGGEVGTDVEAELACTPLPPLVGDRWFHEAVGYEIFVRSFSDSDGDGIGDLRGLIEKLDYLNDGDANTDTDLGVTLLWLMPTFPSPSYHGYDVTDYYGVNPQYGTLADMKELVEESHKRGIRIILDLVMNHSAKQHPWFLDSASEEGDHRDWYVWSATKKEWPRPWGGNPNTWHKHGSAWYYGIFWSGMPDLDYTSPEVRAEMTKVARYWLAEFGVDGFRLDAVRYIVETGPDNGLQDTPETMAWWAELAGTLTHEFPDVLLLGEAWATNSIAAAYHVDGKGLNLTFDFDLMESAIAGMLAEEPADMERVLCTFATHFPADTADASFMTNHDLIRLASRLKEDPQLIRLAAELLFLLPGTPFIYYGQEIGMTNGPTMDDVHKRLPMQWDAGESAGFTSGKPWKAPHSNSKSVNVSAQDKAPESLLNLYRRLIRMRQANRALSLGGFQPVAIVSPGVEGLWAFVRPHPEQTLLVVANLSEAPATSVKVPLSEVASAQQIWPTAKGWVTLDKGILEAGWTAPQTTKVFLLN